MKGIFVLTYNLYLLYAKAWIDIEKMIQTIPDKKLLKTLKNIAVDVDDKSIINMKTIFESVPGITVTMNLFLAHHVSFYSWDPNLISLFQDYPFDTNWILNAGVFSHFLIIFLISSATIILIYIFLSSTGYHIQFKNLEVKPRQNWLSLKKKEQIKTSFFWYYVKSIRRICDIRWK
jgi:hypothetical protein